MAQAIVKGITGQKVAVTVSPNVPITNNAEFKVKVIDNALNIRAGAGTTFKVVGVIKDHGIYTITEVKNNWGKLKSGAGWISLNTKYVNRV